MTDDQFRELCNTFGFAPSRALRELIDCVRAQEPKPPLTDLKVTGVKYFPRKLSQEEMDAIGKPVADINFKEPQPGMVNLDAFRGFCFYDPPKGTFIGEMEMVLWLVRNRDGDYWKAKHGGKA